MTTMSEPPVPGIPDKAALRRAALKRRDALDEDFRAAASRMIVARALPVITAASPQVISLYWPIRSEVDTATLATAMRRAEISVLLPVVEGDDGMRFRVWREAAVLVPAGWGTRGPDASAAEGTPQVVVLPVAGFDRNGHRIGYGKGFYDRAVAALHEAGGHPLLLGLAFSVQEVPLVPAEAHDRRLDFIVTERETLDLRTG
jgi:5-formyltetrahydrofolate cyclo-ligase